MKSIRNVWAVLVALFGLSVTPAGAVHFGQPLKPDEHPAVGKVCFLLDGDRVQFNGTGTLIAPDVVLTVAHVVENAMSPKSLCFMLDMHEKTYFPVVACYMHPDWRDLSASGTNAANDVALLKLAIPVPGNWKPFQVTTQQLQRDEEVTLIGYGTDETGASGTRKMGHLRFYRKASRGWNVFQSGESRFQRADHGDSGGPLFIQKNGDSKIVGLVQGVPDGEFQALDVDAYAKYVSVARHADWIEQAYFDLQNRPSPPLGEPYYFGTRSSDLKAGNPLSLRDYIILLKSGANPDRVNAILRERGVAEWLSEKDVKTLNLPPNRIVAVLPPKKKP